MIVMVKTSMAKVMCNYDDNKAIMKSRKEGK